MAPQTESQANSSSSKILFVRQADKKEKQIPSAPQELAEWASLPGRKAPGSHFSPVSSLTSVPGLLVHGYMPGCLCLGPRVLASNSDPHTSLAASS